MVGNNTGISKEEKGSKLLIRDYVNNKEDLLKTIS